MEWVVIGGIIVYLVNMRKTFSGGHVPPVQGGSNPPPIGAPKANKATRTYKQDTMQETLDKGFNIMSYRNSIFVNNGASNHYWDVSRRQSEKKIHNWADLVNDYVAQVDKRQELAGHIWKKGRISMGYPAGRTPQLPWMITPYIPKPRGNPLSTNSASTFRI